MKYGKETCYNVALGSYGGYNYFTEEFSNIIPFNDVDFDKMNIKDILVADKTVIHCDTYLKSRSLCDYLKSIGKDNYTYETYCYGEEICYDIKNTGFATVNWCEKHEFNVISFDDVDFEDKIVKKVTLDYQDYIGLSFIVSGNVKICTEIKEFGNIVKVFTFLADYDFNNCIFETKSYK